MNIITWMIIMFYTLFPKRLKSFVMEHEVEQPKEMYAWEEIENSQAYSIGKDYIPDLNVNPVSIQSIIRTMAYSDGMTVKKMQHHNLKVTQ